MMDMMDQNLRENPVPKPTLTLVLAAPRGFCAGVDRAIRIVELSIEKYGAPIYVRHEIVHNRFVVERLEKIGAIFIEELDEIPDGSKVIFSAHGVAKTVTAEAQRRQLFYLDATCPLVSKVHVEAQRHSEAGRFIILVGHAGHPEVIGTMGQLPSESVILVETLADAEHLAPPNGVPLAYITQTTLSVDDTAEIVGVLKQRFPDIAGPHKEDICYATTNRQDAIKKVAPQADLVLVIGSANSSNSRRLVEVASKAGAKRARLIENAGEINWAELEGVNIVALSAGASPPGGRFRHVGKGFCARYPFDLSEDVVLRLEVEVMLPRPLTRAYRLGVSTHVAS